MVCVRFVSFLCLVALFSCSLVWLAVCSTLSRFPLLFSPGLFPCSSCHFLFDMLPGIATSDDSSGPASCGQSLDGGCARPLSHQSSSLPP
ncbi:hypothetical protein BDZ85DRAFT_254586 [Elsinoe ampelina]|uniref:Uncharacterized protein n=1 Tax=Elsinoe ampelina TaxID=302913 RepID=A0A6A6GPS0_9PEZI|nr:hypothetical protein BDZ85DRAFT_254586 [Elsinoe ampelina]